MDTAQAAGIVIDEPKRKANLNLTACWARDTIAAAEPFGIV